jgi:protein-tyrosine phosphatase
LDQSAEKEWEVVVVVVAVGMWSTASFCSCPHTHSVGAVSLLTKFQQKSVSKSLTHSVVEDELDFSPPHPDLATVQVAIEDITDAEFVQQWVSSDLWCTPLYYQDALRRWPERHAAAISAIGQACPGGVLFHCIRGHDRTGIVALLLLALVGVTPEDMVADYELSADPYRDELLEREHSSVRDAILSAFEGLSIDSYLRMGGASQDDLAAVRKRLLG